MALHVTQCPSCDSTFNTSARLLEAAHGLVRCGACLSVFEARENFVNLRSHEDPDSADSGQDESVFLSGQEDYLDVARFIRTATGLNDTSMTVTESETETETETENSVAAPPEIPEEKTLPPLTAGNRYDFDALEPVFDSEPSQAESPPAVLALETPVDDTAETDFLEAVSDALPEPATEEFHAIEAPVEAQDIAAQRSAEAATAVPQVPEAVPESKEELRARLRRVRLDDQQEALEDLSDANISAIRQVADPLELLHQLPRRSFWRTFSLSIISCLLLLTLAGQFLWQRVEVLALDENLRPLYQQACDLLNCRLPLLEDLAHLQVENLTVRSHPEEPGALQVTAVLRNQAAFQQAFPQLQMRFSNQSQRLVASRTFMPQDYLPPALHSIVNMPVNTPVQISLDLLDPGADAINYELRLISRRE